MCANRQHRFRVEIKIKEETHEVCVYAKGLAEACGLADAIAHKNWPEEWPTISCHRTPYSSDEMAKEHGAIFFKPMNG